MLRNKKKINNTPPFHVFGIFNFFFYHLDYFHYLLKLLNFYCTSILSIYMWYLCKEYCFQISRYDYMLV